MSRIRVHCLSVSLDGFAAAPDQSAQAPMGVGGERLHDWAFATAFGHAMLGQEGGTTGVDDALLREGFDGIGATIMGRNMFGPVRGPWTDGSWTGWWGMRPPFGHTVVVMTHHARDPLPMAGGTRFVFVTGGVDEAVEVARQESGGADIRLGGGAATVRQFLDARLVDLLHLAIVPIVLGAGERLLDGPAALDELACTRTLAGDGVVHVVLER